MSVTVLVSIHYVHWECVSDCARLHTLCALGLGRYSTEQDNQYNITLFQIFYIQMQS